MLRFVILTHDHPHLHWDFLVELEAGDFLRSWRLQQPPEPGVLIGAEAMADHRRRYLDYEGPVSGNRGEVTRWDFGEAEVTSVNPSEIVLRIAGRRIRGQALLRQNADRDWTFRLSETDA